MTQIARIESVVFAAIESIKDTLPPGVTLASDPDAPLLEGQGGGLDSLGVVNLMVEVESRVEETFGRPVTLVGALSEPAETSPFRTVGALADHIGGLIGESDV